MVINHKVNLINNGIEKGLISKRDKEKYMKHKDKHTLKHLIVMINSQSGGKTFAEAHKIAIGKKKKK
tara:strand:- start:244 stop:444 length:201 start_codon:yes stop_codon:yes gene_type:complete